MLSLKLPATAEFDEIRMEILMVSAFQVQVAHHFYKNGAKVVNGNWHTARVIFTPQGNAYGELEISDVKGEVICTTNSMD